MNYNRQNIIIRNRSMTLVLPGKKAISNAFMIAILMLIFSFSICKGEFYYKATFALGMFLVTSASLYGLLGSYYSNKLFEPKALFLFAQFIYLGVGNFPVVNGNPGWDRSLVICDNL